VTTHVGYINPYRYRGYRYDRETQLYYLQSRYYNPSWGRFINADGIIGQTGELLGHNLFAYCVNNIINLEDPSGFRPVYAGEETDAMREASFAAMSANNKNSSQRKINNVSSSANSSKTMTGTVISSFKEAYKMRVPTLMLATFFTYKDYDSFDGIDDMKNMNKGKKGKSFRGGKKGSRDKWYGYNNKDFQNWWHREGKDEFGGNDIEDKKMVEKVFNYWDSIGKPRVK
ncbi:MAG: hypothetical protein E7211_00235, partial [Clostridium lundense]|nr:hypothetical protein [Clostridium lundense]